MFSEAESLAQQEIDKEKEKPEKEFKPNIFENYDADTGKKIEQPVETPQESIDNKQTTSEGKNGDFEIDTDSLYSSFKPDSDASAYLSKLESNPLTAPVVQQV